MILHICHQRYASLNNRDMPLHTIINRKAKIQNNDNIKRTVKGSVVTRSCGGEWWLVQASNGRDWLWGELGLALVGKATLNKSLIQFSADGWDCEPSLLVVWPEAAQSWSLQSLWQSYGLGCAPASDQLPDITEASSPPLCSAPPRPTPGTQPPWRVLRAEWHRRAASTKFHGSCQQSHLLPPPTQDPGNDAWVRSGLRFAVILHSLGLGWASALQPLENVKKCTPWNPSCTGQGRPESRAQCAAHGGAEASAKSAEQSCRELWAAPLKLQTLQPGPGSWHLRICWLYLLCLMLNSALLGWELPEMQEKRGWRGLGEGQRGRMEPAASRQVGQSLGSPALPRLEQQVSSSWCQDTGEGLESGTRSGPIWPRQGFSGEKLLLWHLSTFRHITLLHFQAPRQMLLSRVSGSPRPPPCSKLN